MANGETGSGAFEGLFIDPYGGVNASDLFCTELIAANTETRRAEILQAARKSAEDWVLTTSTISMTSMALDSIMLVLVVSLRRYRLLQQYGVGFLNYLLCGALFGHVASLIDGLPPSGALCRARLAFIYLFLYGMIAPLLGKTCSLCVTSRNAMLAEHAIAWDRRARRIAMMLTSMQVLMLIIFLGLTAGKPSREVPIRHVSAPGRRMSRGIPCTCPRVALPPPCCLIRPAPGALGHWLPCLYLCISASLWSSPLLRQDRFQTVCSEFVSEHAFHVVNGFITVMLLLSIFAMTAYLQMSAFAAVKRGLRELFLSTIAVMGGAAGLLLLMTTSTQDLSWASAVVPVRLLIILIVSWTVVGSQVGTSAPRMHI